MAFNTAFLFHTFVLKTRPKFLASFLGQAEQKMWASKPRQEGQGWGQCYRAQAKAKVQSILVPWTTTYASELCCAIFPKQL